jgi:hypothetical protein
MILSNADCVRESSVLFSFTKLEDGEGERKRDPYHDVGFDSDFISVIKLYTGS